MVLVKCVQVYEFWAPDTNRIEQIKLTKDGSVLLKEMVSSYVVFRYYYLANANIPQQIQNPTAVRIEP